MCGDPALKGLKGSFVGLSVFSLSSQSSLFVSSDFAAILALLQQVKGPVNVRKYFIQHAMSEAAR